LIQLQERFPLQSNKGSSEKIFNDSFTAKQYVFSCISYLLSIRVASFAIILLYKIIAKVCVIALW